ncbi:MAG: hypothetical protein WCW31_02895 [Patescibacteria group bacterium]|jgi:thymidylate kinase
MVKRSQNDGIHVVVEGIDGSGKSTVLNACRDWAKSLGKQNFFDVVAFSQEHHRLPEMDEIGDADVLLTAEPGFCWTGSAIRDEIIAKRDSRHVTRDTKDESQVTNHESQEPRYSGLETAEAFSLDRLVLFRKIIIPFLQGHPDRMIFQDRGLGSTLAYQPLQDVSLSTELLVKLSGNAQTLAFNPTLLILIRTEAAAAMARLANRTDKKDDHIFEVPDFQQKLAIRFLSDDVLGPFKQAGTIVSEVDGNSGIEQVATAVKGILSTKLENFARM